MLMKFFKPGTLANSEDSGKMPQNVTIHKDLHCLLRQNFIQLICRIPL